MNWIKGKPIILFVCIFALLACTKKFVTQEVHFERSFITGTEVVFSYGYLEVKKKTERIEPIESMKEYRLSSKKVHAIGIFARILNPDKVSIEIVGVSRVGNENKRTRAILKETNQEEIKLFIPGPYIRNKSVVFFVSIEHEGSEIHFSNPIHYKLKSKEGG